ncbi:hypothetical protein HZA97_05980 [Candidatus Woesearchaeota archaeon]|nr:hypothetical protein [Candidatus Woesearchaeota archaeon]
MMNTIRRKLTNTLAAMSLYLGTHKVSGEQEQAPVSSGKFWQEQNPTVERQPRSYQMSGDFEFVPDSERQDPMRRILDNKLPVFEIKHLPENYLAPWESREYKDPIKIYEEKETPYFALLAEQFRQAQAGDKLEGILVGVKSVNSSTTSNSNQVTAQSLGTELTILVQQGLDHEGRQREVTVNFPGIVLSDSIGNWVSYKKFLALGLGDVFKIFPEDRDQYELATLEDQDLKRKYSGSTETEVKPTDIFSKPKYGSLKYMTHELGHMNGGQ